MGRPRNKPFNDEIESDFKAAGLMDNAGTAPMRNTVSGEELRSYIERIERVNAEINVLSDDRKEIYKEFKANGFDPKTLRTIIKRRAMDPEKLDIANAMLDMYLAALGDFADTPLGVAGADRMREGDSGLKQAGA